MDSNRSRKLALIAAAMDCGSLGGESVLDEVLRALPPGTPISVFAYDGAVTCRIGAVRTKSLFGEGRTVQAAVVKAWSTARG